MEEEKDIKRRRDWENNHFMISEAYLKLAGRSRRRPTIKALMKKTGLSHTAIENHLLEIQKFNLEDRYNDMKLLTGDLLVAMYREGKKGKASCAKLFLQIIEDFTEKKEHKIKSLDQLTDEELNSKLQDLAIEESEIDGKNGDSEAKKNQD